MALGLREVCSPSFTPPTQRLGKLGCSTDLPPSEARKTPHGIQKLRQQEGERLGRGGSMNPTAWCWILTNKLGHCPQEGEGKVTRKRFQSLAGARETTWTTYPPFSAVELQLDWLLLTLSPLPPSCHTHD